MTVWSALNLASTFGLLGYELSRYVPMLELGATRSSHGRCETPGTVP
jgi:hypothetical protein